MRKASFTRLTASEQDALRAAKRQWSGRLLAATNVVRAASLGPSPEPVQNVVGVGIGEKRESGQLTGTWALKLLVRRKYPDSQLSEKDRLPTTVDGVPVDVEEVGALRALNSIDPRARHRPAKPGGSIGFVKPGLQMAGTFGALVTDGAHRFILSNNHVLADENRLPAGTPIVQPGTLDGGNPAADQIASLSRAVSLQPGVPNRVDAAIAQISAANVAARDVLFIGNHNGAARAKIHDEVHKFGRTTRYSAGRVTSVETDVWVEYGTGTFYFEDQIIIRSLDAKPFSDAGDSGSLILDRDTGKAVGLLFAGSSVVTIANHLDEVLQALNVTLV